jgi:hypothetical protein
MAVLRGRTSAASGNALLTTATSEHGDFLLLSMLLIVGKHNRLETFAQNAQVAP